MTVNEAKQVLWDKREQLVAYQNGIAVDDESVYRRHARTIAEGRILQIDQDLAVLGLIATD